MYYVDYFESVDYKQEEKKFKVDAVYKTPTKTFERAEFVDTASEAPALLRKWRKEFREMGKSE